LVKIKACKKNKHRNIIDIPSMSADASLRVFLSITQILGKKTIYGWALNRVFKLNARKSETASNGET